MNSVLKILSRFRRFFNFLFRTLNFFNLGLQRAQGRIKFRLRGVRDIGVEGALVLDRAQAAGAGADTDPTLQHDAVDTGVGDVRQSFAGGTVFSVGNVVSAHRGFPGNHALAAHGLVPF